jgi:hypothetical protein
LAIPAYAQVDLLAMKQLTEEKSIRSRGTEVGPSLKPLLGKLVQRVTLSDVCYPDCAKNTQDRMRSDRWQIGKIAVNPDHRQRVEKIDLKPMNERG